MAGAILLATTIWWIWTPSSPPTPAATSAPAASVSVHGDGRLETVVVPYGKDDDGKEIYSEPVLVTAGRFSYGFDSSDPGTGCLKVKVNSEERGISCAGHYLDLAMTDGKGENVRLQFHAVGRPMKLVVRHST